MIIKLNEMVFYGFHGVHDEERKLGQRFIVTVHMCTDPESDEGIRHLDDTVDYTKVYAEIKRILETHQFRLLELCAKMIADNLLEDFPLIKEVSVFIKKPSVPIQGILNSVEVEFTKSR
ncbi:MAG: dihydroneopterin aldolase [Candidatus Syntrophosphaera sp.]|jgi:7,8-dihydroneopterin aldolase/epimerase/oxygenase